MKWAMLACDLVVLAWGASLAGRELEQVVSQFRAKLRRWWAGDARC